ncbi:MAG: hypoxanthine phosphoribosyltransferase [Proteobacteria bacterium]|nr:hypoxanthine phosphoribosyltransferase [Pseudomonadota bacterium]
MTEAQEEWPERRFITAQEFLEDSFRLGLKVLDSDFAPKFIVGVWRGGTPTGIAVQEILDYHGVKTDHIAIRTSAYSGTKRDKVVRVHGLEYIIDNISPEDNLLIVDDVFDSGSSIAAIIEKLNQKCRRNTPNLVKIATVYYKPKRNRTDIVPDFYVHETDAWLVFPHEFDGLSLSEIKDGKGIDFDELRKPVLSAASAQDDQ